jgi:hypothetical protein
MKPGVEETPTSSTYSSRAVAPFLDRYAVVDLKSVTQPASKVHSLSPFSWSWARSRPVRSSTPLSHGCNIRLPSVSPSVTNLSNNNGESAWLRCLWTVVVVPHRTTHARHSSVYVISKNRRVTRCTSSWLIEFVKPHHKYQDREFDAKKLKETKGQGC